MQRSHSVGAVTLSRSGHTQSDPSSSEIRRPSLTQDPPPKL